MDFRRRSNQLLALILVVTAGIAGFLWLNDEPAEIWISPVYVFLIWALLREIDPDHDWTALAGAVATAVWVLSGGPVTSGLAIAGLMVAARITTSTTGRRPLPTDLAAAAVFAIAIGFSVAGWAAGFGIALAIYLDDRYRGDSRLAAIAASALAAIGTTALAHTTGSFPERFPDIIQAVVIASGVAGVLLSARDPADPISQVDARHAAFLDGSRLHASRSVVGVLVFLMAILSGEEADGLIVVIAALGLAVVSNEIELLRRRRL